MIHRFDYNLDFALPSPKTISIDHWGFWNGGYEISVSDIENYCLNMINNRNSSGNRYNAGLLTKVTYPTGGKTEITYEPNKYDRYIERSMQQAQLNIMSTNESITCGGARVTQIKDYDPVSARASNSRTFQYFIPQTGKGSGIIGNNPKYTSSEYVQFYSYDFSSQYDYHNIISYTDVSSNSLGYNENLAEYHIGYSHVIEKLSDGSYIYYHYTSHDDVPNSMEGTNCKIVEVPLMGRAPITIQSGSTDLNDLEVREKSCLYIPNDLSHFRGKLKSKICYNSTGTKVQTETYTYNIGSAKNSYNISVSSVYRGRAAYKIYLIPCLLEKKEITDANGVVQTAYYQYNNYSLISEEKTTNSDSKEFIVQYSYPADYVYNSLGTGEKLLFDKNILSKPLTIKKLTPGKTIESLSFAYKVENSLPVLASVKRLEGSIWKTMMEYPRYDSYGNPVHTIENGLLQNVYLWSYKGQRIVAQIVNASYSDVSAKAQAAGLNLTSLATSNLLSNSDLDKLNALRSSIPKAQITTYKYKPLIGIESITDPRGFTTYYDYDGFTRLKEIHFNKSGVKKTVESYEYNYIN